MWEWKRCKTAKQYAGKRVRKSLKDEWGKRYLRARRYPEQLQHSMPRAYVILFSLEKDSLLVERLIVFFSFPGVLPEPFLSAFSLLHAFHDGLILRTI